MQKSTSPVPNIRLCYMFYGTRVAVRHDADVYWLHGDHLGSASLTTNITGAVVSEMCYYPFGETHWVSEGVTFVP